MLDAKTAVPSEVYSSLSNRHSFLKRTARKKNSKISKMYYMDIHVRY